MAEPSPQPKRSSLPHTRTRGIFVGRQREMSQLMAALDDAMSGQGRLVMLVGEPGIGKTRTARELAAHAERQGAQVLWGWCYEDEGAPSYWPWVQLLRAYVQRADAEQLIAEIGPGAADIAEIIPEVRQKLPGLEPSPALEPVQARFRLFDCIASFLKRAAQSRPLLLVLDDLHWADKPSLLLLEFLARLLGDSHILVVGCYRDVELSRQHPLSETLGQLAREPVFQRELLRGLTEEETGRFIETAAGADAPGELVAAVYTHTEGNPFFMAEIIRLMLEQGDLFNQDIAEDGNIRIPEGVKEVIGRRLNRLSDRCNQALTTASVIGREFDFRLLSSLADNMSEDKLLGAADEAVTAQLIEEVPNRIERFQFTHALIQQTLAEELTTTRRVRLHARIGEALEELYGEHVEEQAAELAHHFGEAESLAGPEKLVHFSSMAGERALSNFAYEEAQAHFQRALEAKVVSLNGLEPAPDGEAAAVSCLVPSPVRWTSQFFPRISPMFHA